MLLRNDLNYTILKSSYVQDEERFWNLQEAVLPVGCVSPGTWQRRRRRGCGFLGELAVCLFSVGLCLRLLLFSQAEASSVLTWIGNHSVRLCGIR